MQVEFSFLSLDKKTTIHGVKWVPETSVQAVLQLSHGMIEYIERYRDFAEYLNRFGFLVVGNDHLGHGQSVTGPEDWGYFAEKDGGAFLVEDLHRVTELVKTEYPGVPVFLMGHSMGSFMARRYLTKYGAEINGAIVMGTGHQNGLLLTVGRVLCGFLAELRGSRHRSPLMHRLMFGAYNRRVPSPQSKNDWLTSDRSIVEEYDRTPACSFLFTVSGLKQIFDTIAYVKDGANVARVPKELPILVIAGKEDPVGEYGRAVTRTYEQYRKLGVADVRLHLVENARHEILNETNRQETYEVLREWLEEHSGARKAREQEGRIV